MRVFLETVFEVVCVLLIFLALTVGLWIVVEYGLFPIFR